MKTILVLAASAALLVSGRHLVAAPTADEKVHAALKEIVLRLLDDEKGLFVGMDVDDAIEASKGAANIGGEYYTRLENAPFAPDGDWTGVVNAFVDFEEEEALTDLAVVLFVDDYDKGKTGQFLTKLARDQGIDLEQDPDDRTAYFSTNDVERNLWFGLGDGAIAISVDVHEYEDY